MKQFITVSGRRTMGRLGAMKADATQRLKRGLLRSNILLPPLRISLDITDACNFQCPGCSKWKASPSKNELSLDLWLEVIQKLKGFPLLKEVAISGGEPFVHKDIYRILRAIKDAGFRAVIVSNGAALSSEELMVLDDMRLDMLLLSLNSLNAVRHDRTRGTTGSWQHIQKLIDSWQHTGRHMALGLSTIVMQSNCHELADMARFVDISGLSGIAYQVLLPAETHYAFSGNREIQAVDADWTVHNPDWIDDLPLLTAQIQELLELQKQGVSVFNPPMQLKAFVNYFARKGLIHDEWPCLATRNRLFVDPMGDVRLCYGYAPVGNILKESPGSLWRSAQARDIRRRSALCTRPCRLQNCNI